MIMGMCRFTLKLNFAHSDKAADGPGKTVSRTGKAAATLGKTDASQSNAGLLTTSVVPLWLDN